LSKSRRRFGTEWQSTWRIVRARQTSKPMVVSANLDDRRGGRGFGRDRSDVSEDVTMGERRRELIRQALDRDHMLAVMQEILPPLAGEPVRIKACKSKLKKVKVEDPDSDSPLEIVYYVVVESETGQEWNCPVLATLPVAPDHVAARLPSGNGEALSSTMAEPFARLTTYVPTLRMAIQMLPLDPGLPALLEVTGPRRCAFLAQYLPECRAGAIVEDVRIELRQYNRGIRAVLRCSARFAGTPAPPEHSVYVKIMKDDDRVAKNYESMRRLWDATRDATYFHMPKPLGHAPGLRTLVMEEGGGGFDIVDWIRSLERDETLPPHVDRPRLEQCVVVIARSLAEIHGCGVQLADRTTFAGELEARRDEYEALRKLEPRIAEHVAPLLDRLAALAPEHEELVCSHGGFRHKQMLGDDQHLTVVDWDGMTMAHPALDASGFLSHLRQVPVRQPGHAEMLEHMALAFRCEFLACEPGVSPRDLACYEAMAFAKKACRSYRRKIKDAEQFAERMRLIPAAHELLDTAME
jgi:aminoglycoside phosphotransferase (APT) family kinase protein